jgi:glyoxylase-like metal-dependent hydrolase (beta-lactamase superfamily II)
MILRQLRNPESSSFTYVVGDRKHSRAVLIDPVPAHCERDLTVLSELGLTLDYVLVTHRGPDHELAARLIRERTGARVACGEGGVAGADLIVHDGDVLRFGQREVRVLSTPGNAEGSVTYLVGRRAFTGAVLCVRGCGRVPGRSDPSELFDSVVNVLFALPDETLVYPGQDGGGVSHTTIGAERHFNPDVARRDRASFIDRYNA